MKASQAVGAGALGLIFGTNIQSILSNCELIAFSDFDMSGRPGSTSGNELLDSLLSNIGQAGASASPLGTLLSTLGQPQPGSSTSSRLSPSPLLSSAEVAQPAISPLLLGAGRLLLQNWQPVLQVVARRVLKV